METNLTNGNGNGVVCQQHLDVVKGMTEVTVILRQVRDEIAEICRKFDAHVELEGHPLLSQKVKNLEEGHKIHMALLAQQMENARALTETVHLMQSEQRARVEERNVRLDAKTKVLVAGLAFAGVIGGALVGLLK